MALALARRTHAPPAARAAPIRLYRHLSSPTGLLRADMGKCAPTAHHWPRAGHCDGSLRRLLSHVRCWSLVSLAHSQRSSAARLLLPDHEWPCRRIVFPRLPAHGSDAVDRLDWLGLARQHRLLYPLPSARQMELAQHRGPWPGPT